MAQRGCLALPDREMQIARLRCRRARPRSVHACGLRAQRAKARRAAQRRMRSAPQNDVSPVRRPTRRSGKVYPPPSLVHDPSLSAAPEGIFAFSTPPQCRALFLSAIFCRTP
eukprot:6183394-Pleurochrysis_carterae.AAC.1